MDVRPVRSVGMTAFAARKLVDVLRMVCAGLTRVPDDHLSISICKSDVRGSHCLRNHETACLAWIAPLTLIAFAALGDTRTAA